MRNVVQQLFDKDAIDDNKKMEKLHKHGHFVDYMQHWFLHTLRRAQRPRVPCWILLTTAQGMLRSTPLWQMTTLLKPATFHQCSHRVSLETLSGKLKR